MCIMCNINVILIIYVLICNVNNIINININDNIN